MDTKVIYMDENNLDYDALKDAACIINKGGWLRFLQRLFMALALMHLMLKQ